MGADPCLVGLLRGPPSTQLLYCRWQHGKHQAELEHERIIVLADVGYVTRDCRGKLQGYVSPPAGLTLAGATMLSQLSPRFLQLVACPRLHGFRAFSFFLDDGSTESFKRHRLTELKHGRISFS
mmetsp:Transcript_31945/g.69836  ORF Transcript_31945/g.69836 Transcript_31945/m.69836 type:complete len:124 (+) Transcript_31945:87-458(+)